VTAGHYTIYICTNTLKLEKYIHTHWRLFIKNKD
jgi:hypothetical protein